MKRISTFFLAALAFNAANAQDFFPTTQRSTLVEFGASTCLPCYSWAKPMMEFFKTSNPGKVITMDVQWSTVYPPEISSNNCYNLFNDYMNMPYSASWGTPTLFLNHRVKWTTADDSLYKLDMQASIDSTNDLPALASPIFQVTRVGSDSMIIDTKTKFLQDATGNYRVTVWLAQDSIWYSQNGATGGYTYHMHKFKGPNWEYNSDYTIITYNGNDSMSYPLNEGPVAANTIVEKTFHFKLDSTQISQHIHPIIVISDYVVDYPVLDLSDSSIWYYPKHVYVNATEDEGFGPAGIAPVSNTYTATIFPSPASDHITTCLKNITGDVALTIVDVSGHQVLSKQVTDNERINISELSNGSYFYSYSVHNVSIMNGALVVSH